MMTREGMVYAPCLLLVAVLVLLLLLLLLKHAAMPLFAQQ